MDLTDQLALKCARTVAFVFAPNAQSGQGIYEAGSVLRDAHVAAIFLMADESAAEDAIEAMRKLERKGRGPLVQAAEFDFSTVYGGNTSQPHFHLEELSEDLLHVIRALSESVLDVYEDVLLVDTSQDVLQRTELTELFNSVDESAHDHMPYVLSRTYLDSL